MFKNCFVLFFIFLTIFHFTSFANSDSTRKERSRGYSDYVINDQLTYRYKKQNPVKFLVNPVFNIGIGARSAVKKENLWKTGAVIGGTVVLVLMDQSMIDASQQFGRYINLSTSRRMKTLAEFKIFGQNAPIEIPANFSSTLYYIGEGWPAIITTLGFCSYGVIKKDYRAISTASQIVETLLAVGITTQLIKHVTGRESPRVASQPGGAWKPFPSLKEYNANVSKHDAFSSGHFATLTGVLTAIALNYPNSKIIKPVAYTLSGLLCYQMMNNGVHWFSDYPLAFVLGFGFAHISANRRIEKISSSGNPISRFMKEENLKFHPGLVNGGVGMSLTYKFD